MGNTEQYFYVFINIKGALYTADWVKFISSSIQQQEDPTYSEIVKDMLLKHPNWTKFYHNKGYERSKSVRKICPHNVQALNVLLDNLKQSYNVNLVITSPKWKEQFDLKTIPALIKNGLDYSGLILDKTDNKIDNTSESIKTYLGQVGNPSNYLVIDYQDEVNRNFGKDKVIIVDQYESGLNKDIVDNYLANTTFQSLEDATTSPNMLEDVELAIQ